MRTPEFYPKKQGRPETPETKDLETGQSSLYSSYSSLWEEYVELKDLMDRLINEQISKITEVLIELQQIKFHLASMSDAGIDESDTEVD